MQKKRGGMGSGHEAKEKRCCCGMHGGYGFQFNQTGVGQHGHRPDQIWDLVVLISGQVQSRVPHHKGRVARGWGNWQVGDVLASTSAIVAVQGIGC